jgi:hypothetical protein
MANGRYEAVIRGATETRNIDFKAAMHWSNAPLCARLEILRDVAAMANAGGGYIVIGRDEPHHITGSVTPEEAASFDPTKVNSTVHRYLTPPHECRVEPETVGADTLVVIEVPEFETSPLIFREVGNCGKPPCTRGPHFLPGDVFVRTKAQESRRVTGSEEMGDIVNRAVRKRQDELVTALQSMLTASQNLEVPEETSPYDDELEDEDGEFFKPFFGPWLQSLGHFDLAIHPVEYREDRVELQATPRLIRELAFVICRNGVFDGIPYEGNHDGENFSRGARLMLRELRWRQLEAVSLSTSGLYRLVRSFPEDYRPNEDRTAAELVMDDREMWVDSLVEQVTMLYLLARNVALRTTDNEDETIQVNLRIDGLAGRKARANSLDPLEQFRIGLGQQTGTQNSFYFPLRTTARALRTDAVTLARDRCNRIFWTFGVHDQSILPLQRRLLGKTEPLALR